MTSDGVNLTDDTTLTEMAECDGDKVVTMVDVLQEQQKFEEDANAVLGASDHKNCTYSKGYIKRQALYACMTCCPDSKTDPTKRAGVCLACSLSCHENHDLLELYTKRNFRCDCGNPKFKNNPCQFTPNKTDLNEENIYNQNFGGFYCTCHRPYPDPESNMDDDMHQCVICEDWYHASHLEAVVPFHELFSEVICKACMDNNEFLHDYTPLAINAESYRVDIIRLNGESPTLIEYTPVGLNKNNSNKGVVEKDSDVQIPTKELSDISIKDDEKITQMETDEPQEKNETVNDAEQKEGKNSDVKMETTDDEKSINEPSKGSLKTEEIEDKSSGMKNESDEANKVEQFNANKTTVEGGQIPSDDIGINNSTQEQNEGKEIIETQVAEQIPLDKEYTEQSSETADIEVPDTSQNPDTNEDRADAVMEAIDELLQDTPKNIVPENDVEQASMEEIEKNENKPKKNSVCELKASDKILADSDKQPEADSDEINKSQEGDAKDIATDDTITKNEYKRKIGSGLPEELSPKKAKVMECKRPEGGPRLYNGATFWGSALRRNLCRCKVCMLMYKDLDVLYLTDYEDTVAAYEHLGKANEDIIGSQYEKGLRALSSLGRVEQINALTEYNKMKEKLLEFLKSFKDRKEIVKEEDIRAFFAGMSPKREPDGVYFCK